MKLQKITGTNILKLKLMIPMALVFFLSGNVLASTGSAKNEITNREDTVVTGQKTNPIDPDKRPVIVLDGKVMPDGFDPGSINTNNILSVDVIKPETKEKREEAIAKYGKRAENGVILIIRKKDLTESTAQARKQTDSQGNKIYSVVEMRPLFPGGDQKLTEFIRKNLVYPPAAREKKIQGRVIVRFVVNSIGTVEQSEVIRGLDPECDKEALRIVDSLPAFIPGQQNGKNVAVFYILPVGFSLK